MPEVTRFPVRGPSRSSLGPGPVVVTGAGGWIGSLLVSRLSETSPETKIYAPNRDDLDLADSPVVELFLEQIRPRAVVHLAASMARDADPPSRAAQWRDTFLAGRNVVHAAAMVGVRQLIMAGTMEELGDQPGVLHTELPVQPRTTYGLCKALLKEVACLEARRGRVRVDWIRPTTAYGPGQRGTMLIPSACSSACTGRPASFTNGIQKRDFIFVYDLLDWILLALDDRVTGRGDPGFHLHHLGTGVGVAVGQVLDLIASELPKARFELGAITRRENEPLVQIAAPYRSGDPVLSSWRAKTTWQMGIRKTAAWWRNQAAAPMGG